MGCEIEVQQTANKNVYFCEADFAIFFFIFAIPVNVARIVCACLLYSGGSSHKLGGRFQ